MNESCVCIYNGLLLSHKKEWNLIIFDIMDAARDYYAKWNKSDRERNIPYDFTYMWNLKKKTDKWTNTVKQNYRYTEQSGICQRERRRKEIVEGDYQVQTFSCKINESWVWNVQCG